MKNNIFLELIKKTFPPSRVGSLYISDSDLKLALIEKGKLIAISIHLPAGVIENGEIKDEQKFLSALKKLHNSLIDFQTKIELVVCLPPQIIYNYYFSVPSLSQEEINQSASLNLKMKSPQPYNETYADWQVIGEKNDEVQILGAYGNKELINKFSSLLYQANFLPVAFEFQGLALTRLLKTFNPELIKISFLLIYISKQGMNLSFIKKGNLYFDYFVSWNKKQFKLEEFEGIIEGEIKKVLNFCQINLKESFSKIFLISSIEESSIKKSIEISTPLEVSIYRIKKYDISPDWYISLGSLLKNTEYFGHSLNLSGEKLQKDLRIETIKRLGILWRDVISGFLLLFIIVIMSFNAFLVRYNKELKKQLQSIILPSEVKKVQELKTSADNFNKLVKIISEVEKSRSHYARKISKLIDLTERKIILTYISISGNSIRVQGISPNEKEIIDFKNRLEKNNFKNVNLPLSRMYSFGNKTKFVLSCRISEK